jgi:hypothetical protein
VWRQQPGVKQQPAVVESQVHQQASLLHVHAGNGQVLNLQVALQQTVCCMCVALASYPESHHHHHHPIKP